MDTELPTPTIKKNLFQNKISIKKSSIHGYGVFTEKTLEKGELIEECYGLKLKNNTYEPTLNYEFKISKGCSFLPTGHGMIYNHCDQPNVDYLFDTEKSLLLFYANKKILKGEELLINYGKDWFSNRNLTYKKKSNSYYIKAFFKSPIFRGTFVCGLAYLFLFLLKTK